MLCAQVTAAFDCPSHGHVQGLWPFWHPAACEQSAARLKFQYFVKLFPRNVVQTQMLLDGVQLVA